MTTSPTVVRTRRHRIGNLRSGWRDQPSDFKCIIGSALVGGIPVWAWLNTSMSSDFGLPLVAFWSGFALWLAVMIGNEDNHFNPLVTTGAKLGGLFQFNIVRVLIRFGEQFLGVWIFVMLMWALFGGQAVDENFGAPLPTAGIFAAQFGVGLLFGFIFVFLTLVVIAKTPPVRRGWKVKRALVLGFLLMLCVYFSAKYAGGGMNTARELITMAYGLDMNLWPVFGELAGAAVGGVLFKVVNRNGRLSR